MTQGRERLLASSVGIGLRSPHLRDLISNKPKIDWVELLIDNYLNLEGGLLEQQLLEILEYYPASFHGVGLSLGGTDPLDMRYLKQLKSWVDRINPQLISEHLSWSQFEGQYLPDLLPLPYTIETAQWVADRIRQVQNYLGRQILIENLSSYIQYDDSKMPEWEFLMTVAERADCFILLDINNIYVSSQNHGFSAQAYLRAMDPARVSEYHLAGHLKNQNILIDTHSRPVCADVWELYAQALRLIGPRPTLIEWDADIPELSVLLDQANYAKQQIQHYV